MTECDASQAARRQWLAVLARASADELAQALAALPDLPTGVPVRAPECGMVMLRGRIGGTGDAFNLGEATVTRAALRLGAHLGVGYTLGRDKRKAERIAWCDALLQDAAHHGVVQARVVAPLARTQAAARDQASREAAASRVEFFTMVRGEAA